MTNFSKKTNGQFFQKKANAHGVKAHGHPFTWAWIHRDITFFSSGTSPFLASNLPCRHGKIFVEFPGRNMEYWSENAVIRGNDNCRCPVTGPMISCRFLHVWRMCLCPQVPYYLGHALKTWVYSQHSQKGSEKGVCNQDLFWKQNTTIATCWPEDFLSVSLC